MSNEHEAIFGAFISKCSSIYVVAGMFGQTDVELSVQRHNDNKLQISVGGLAPTNAIAVLDSLGISVDDSASMEAPKKKRSKKVAREAEKLAVEDASDAVVACNEPAQDPPKKRRKRRTQEEIAADKAAEQASQEPAKKRRKRRTQEEIAADKAAEQAAEQASQEPAKKRRRHKKEEPPTPLPKEDDAFSLDDTQMELVGAAKVADDVIEVIIFDALPEDADEEQCVAAVISVQDSGVAPALRGWTKSEIKEVVLQFFKPQ